MRKRALVFVAVMALARVAAAADSPVGTWVKKAEGKQTAMTLKIERWGDGGAKLTWEIKQANMTLSLESKLDGKDAPLLINGKPSGETMAITRVDKLHSATVVKMNGKPFGTSKGSFSADFKTLTVENDFTESGGGNQAGKSTEHWTRQ